MVDWDKGMKIYFENILHLRLWEKVEFFRTVCVWYKHW